jgi:Ca2+-binding EF-hand superfamily protein
MKTIPVCFLVAGMLVPTAFPARSEEPGSKPRREVKDGTRPPLKRSAEIWKAADTNQDGGISAEEFAEMPRLRDLPDEKRAKLFSRLDKNGDGNLSHVELDHFGKPRDGQKGSPMKRFWELDVDKSGGVSFEEFKQGQLSQKLSAAKQEAVFQKLDTDRDGMITPKDRPQLPANRPPGGPRQARAEHGKRGDSPGSLTGIELKLDQNGDGALSFEEFRAGPAVKGLSEDEQEDRFEKLDRNQDQILSPADFKQAEPQPK